MSDERAEKQLLRVLKTAGNVEEHKREFVKV